MSEKPLRERAPRMTRHATRRVLSFASLFDSSLVWLHKPNLNIELHMVTNFCVCVWREKMATIHQKLVETYGEGCKRLYNMSLGSSILGQKDGGCQWTHMIMCVSLFCKHNPKLAHKGLMADLSLSTIFARPGFKWLSLCFQIWNVI